MAELGWTRKAIKDILGVTPTTMRPPYGDIGQYTSRRYSNCRVIQLNSLPTSDDRVRAIALAMGMVPIIWTSSPTGGPFDTNGMPSFFLYRNGAWSQFSGISDWRVAGGQVNGTYSFETFEAILGNATTLDTGFIVLQHDLFEITVDLATGYTLPAALNHDPKFNVRAILHF